MARNGSVSKGDEYLDLMRRIALPEYLATRGNRGAWCLYRTEADVTHFEMPTFWDDTDAIKRFAGDDYSMAKYYDFDSDYLIEMEARVRHYDVWPVTEDQRKLEDTVQAIFKKNAMSLEKPTN